MRGEAPTSSKHSGSSSPSPLRSQHKGRLQPQQIPTIPTTFPLPTIPPPHHPPAPSPASELSPSPEELRERVPAAPALQPEPQGQADGVAAALAAAAHGRWLPLCPPAAAAALPERGERRRARRVLHAVEGEDLVAAPIGAAAPRAGELFHASLTGPAPALGCHGLRLGPHAETLLAQQPPNPTRQHTDCCHMSTAATARHRTAHQTQSPQTQSPQTQSPQHRAHRHI